MARALLAISCRRRLDGQPQRTKFPNRKKWNSSVEVVIYTYIIQFKVIFNVWFLIFIVLSFII